MNFFAKIQLSRKRRVSLYGIILLEVIAISFIIPSSSSTGEIPTPQINSPLGTWFNMPNSSSCSLGNTTARICELMGNSTYRGLYVSIASSGESGVRASLSINCVTPSNTVGANLQLQYANFSITTNTNSSNFADLTGLNVFIDNSVNNSCPGTLVSSTTVPLPAIAATPISFIFRVVGIGGGGTGDNPRLGSVTTILFQTINRFFDVIVTARSTTQFTAVAFSIPTPVAINTIINFSWIATNNFVLGQSGSNSCTILASGTSCSVVTTFGMAFATTPDITLTPRTGSQIATTQISSITLLNVQVITV